MVASAGTAGVAVDGLLSILAEMREIIAPRTRRGLRQFAEEEIVIPDGPYAGTRFSPDRQPAHRLILDAVDGGSPDGSPWADVCVLGPTQSGKTLVGFVIPTLHALFELREPRVIVAVPSGNMGSNKWSADLRPVIERSRFATQLPASGAGSRGGNPIERSGEMRMANGCALEVMTGGGGDKSRAGSTARAVFMTEADAFGVTSEHSKEADKFTQLRGRTNAFDDRAFMQYECTVSIEAGIVWRTWTDDNSTGSRIAQRCPHCGAYVTPEREHLVGWKDQPTRRDAERSAAWCCPACGGLWTEADRRAALEAGVLVHRGQSVNPDGTPEGEPPDTRVLAIRYTSADNLFVSPGTIGGEEWMLERSRAEGTPEEVTERSVNLKQQRHVLPRTAEDLYGSDLTAKDVTRRVLPGSKRGVVPADTLHLGLGIDVGRWTCYGVVIAARANRTAHVVAYDARNLAESSMSVGDAIRANILDLFDQFDGLPGADGSTWTPDVALVDVGDGNTDDDVFAALNHVSGRFGGTDVYGAKGFAATQYQRPRGVGKSVKRIGHGHHVVGYRRAARPGSPWAGRVVHHDTDAGKVQMQQGLAQPDHTPGAVTLYDHPNTAREHRQFSEHMLAERQSEEFTPGRGLVVRMVRVRRHNHHLDAARVALLACVMAGADFSAPPEEGEHTDTERRPRQRSAEPITRPGASSWLPQAARR